MRTVQGLLNANFVFEVRIIEWFSKVMLVKKATWKWRMYIKYNDLSHAFHKKLVSSSKYR